MSGKRLRTDAVVSELATGSVFFQHQPEPGRSAAVQEESPLSPPDEDGASPRASTADSTRDSEQASMQAGPLDSTHARPPAVGLARTHASLPASVQSRVHARGLAGELASSHDLTEAIYRVIRRPGKDISYVRMTDREKSAVGQVLAGIQQEHGYKVSETELIRVAICALLADHADHEDESMLMRVVRALKD